MEEEKAMNAVEKGAGKLENGWGVCSLRGTGVGVPQMESSQQG